MSAAGRVDQMLAGFADGDAISCEARELRDILRRQGVASDIYVPASRIGAGVRDECRPLQAYVSRPCDTVVYHMSTHSDAAAAFVESRARRVLRYHNITPAVFFDGFDDRVAKELRAARAALPGLAALADSVLAVSDYNAAELRTLGIDRVEVLPLLFSAEALAVEPDAVALRRFDAGLKNILFVGRMAPNKCVEELILAFAWYHGCIESRSRLILVGSDRSCPRYYAMLRMLAARLGLTNVCFEGFVTESWLAACYEVADLFVCTSRHEGFCLPLVEAMARETPVIARDAGGMPEVLGDAGVLYDDASPPVLAELMARVLTEGALRDRVLAAQARRLTQIRAQDLAARCRRLFVPAAHTDA